MLLQNLNIFNGRTAKFYYIIFNLIAVTICIYIGVDTFYRVVRMKYTNAQAQSPITRAIEEETSSVKSELSDYKVISDRNIFSNVDVAAKDSAVNIDDLDSTSLKLALIGTIAGNDETSAAIIQDSSIKPVTKGLYRIGDKVQDAEIKSIFRKKVVLRVGNKDEVLSMEEAGSRDTATPAVQTTAVSTQSSAATIVRDIPIKRALINESLGDLNELLSQASIKPHSTDGEPDGLTITGIKAGSIYRRMGLRNGDIITGVNDEPIKSTEDIVGMYNDLKSSPEISLQITRRGQERSFNYTISD
ncbi:MAG: PDZ domain-containing protein [Deltaproteobacteria bacterium]|nr:PDZ domain-containing protein [Deltaproteobacteria bacterium]